MPNEPDNKMDDLLKAYARKRRADAGDSNELHPATRRLLQAEAARLRPRSERMSWSWPRLILLRWPAIAVAVGVFVVLAIGFRWLLPWRDSGGQQMFAKQDAAADRLTEGLVRKEKELRESKDGLVRAPEPVRDEKEKLSADRSAELVRNEPGKPMAAADKARAATPPAIDGPRPTSSASSEPARSAIPAPTAPPAEPAVEQRLQRQLAAAPVDSVARFNLGTFTNASAPSEVAFWFGEQLVGGVNAAQSKQNEIAPTPAAAPSARPAAPAQETAVTLADAATLRQQQLNLAPSVAKDSQRVGALGLENATSAVSQIQNVPAQTGQAAPTLNVVLAKNEDSYSQNAAASGVSPLNRGSAPAAAPADGRVQNARFARQLTVPPATVLTRFELEQQGDRVRVLDGDGSVYEGTVLGGGGVAPALLFETAGGARRQAGASTGPAESRSGAGVPFRAVGTNRTLNLSVFLEGTFVSGTAGSSAIVTGRGTQGLAAVNGSTNGAPPRIIERIVGRARIGATNEISINATRAGN